MKYTIPLWDIKYRLFIFAIPTAFLLFASARLEQQITCKKIRLLTFLGDSYYVLYLAQGFLIIVYFKAVTLSRIASNTVTISLFTIGVILFTVCVSGMYHLFIEKKIVKKLRS